ncbi:hypothetical protein SDC9_153813 [bioreactor metagenome]|uniref:Uncharacterized protein n=1 Tax=bioreactor metagenome TaxID=1076179 RepID=A0A645EXC5_9ZZZZ
MGILSDHAGRLVAAYDIFGYLHAILSGINSRKHITDIQIELKPTRHQAVFYLQAIVHVEGG